MLVFALLLKGKSLPPSTKGGDFFPKKFVEFLKFFFFSENFKNLKKVPKKFLRKFHLLC